jgi:SpoVK/Ycf46/Vps4 family AAA+-type ATPase
MAGVKANMATIPTSSTIRTNKKPDLTLDEVLKEISDLIGMDEIKEELNQLIAFGRLIALRKKRDIPLEKVSLHLIFTGPPGTGKTVMARKIGKLFKAIGLLRQGQCVEVDRSKLVGSYQGQTAPLVEGAVKDAIDGVLFIDEAYALLGGNETSDQYGIEAINTLLKLMEDNRDRLVVIIAGQASPIRKLVDSNVGLRSRFTRTFDFKSYSHEELFQIFEFIANEGGYILEADARREVERYVRTWNRESLDFGNARQVRSFFEGLLPVQAMRLAALPDLESLTNETLLTITVDDVRAAERW